MRDAPLRRTLTVSLIYLAGAYLVLLLGGWLRRVLALPPLFHTLLTWGLWLGAPVAALLAWYYPKLGSPDEGTEPGDPTPRRR